jgi:glycerol-3-phosphate acyltransferase PlsY
MAAAVSFPFIVMWWLNETVTSMNVFAIAVPILVLITHQKNIERILKRTESRVYLFRRKH